MLTLRNIQKTYRGGVKALDGIDLQVAPGMFGLLGPNGAGKSSLMRTIAGLQLPDGGTIKFDGIDVIDQPQRLREQLGYLPQSFGAYPFLGCRALLRHMSILKGLPDNKDTREQVDRLLELTNLTAHARRPVSKFSGGMRQRFGIAQALLGDPRLLILDEPTAGLDPEERLRLYNLLSQLSQDRVVLLSTHIVDDVEQLCPRLAVIRAGKIVAHGETDALVRRLDGEVWQAGAEAVPPQDAIRLSTAFRRGAPRHRYRFAGDPGLGFEKVKPTLQDLYFHELNAGASANV